MRSSEVTEPVPQPLSSAGTTLKNTREEWGLSVGEVADNLNLGAETIEALESDDYSSLPGTTFIRGYIRSYAKLLQLDVEGLMGNIDLQPERITEIPSTRAALRMKGKTRNREKGKKKSGLLKWLVIFILLGLVLFVVAKLPKLGIEPVNNLLNKVGVKTESAPVSQSENQLLIPPQSDSSGQPVGNEGQADQPKGALIRIE